MPTVRALMAIVLFLSLTQRGAAQSISTKAEGDEILLASVSIQQPVRGVILTLPVSVFLAARTFTETSQARPTSVTLSARLIVDLSALQRQLGPIVDSIPLPTDHCDHLGVDNLEIHITGRDLVNEGERSERATLRLRGTALAWYCQEISILGFSRRVLGEVNPPGRQDFVARIPLRLSVPSSRTVALELLEPSLNLTGVFGGVVGTVLRLGGVNLSDVFRDSLQRTIDPGMLQATLPAELEPFKLSFKNATFFDNSGSLAASIELTATIDSDFIEQWRVST